MSGAGGSSAGDARPSPSPDRVARAALSAVVEPAVLKVAARVAAAGAEATWRAVVGHDRRLDHDGVLARRAAGVDGSAVLRHGAELGLRFICPGDPGWPTALDAMAATLGNGPDAVPPPFGLWIRGAESLGDRSGGAGARTVAVVGARAASPYGKHVAADLGADLAGLGWTVVSGAAYGIDAAAHRGALAMAGTTHAVLACGLDIAYPPSHADLLARIAASGLVISELAPGMKPMRSRFIARNRIIAGLAAGTVVVEAARRSGALSTANWAEKLGREVMMVPGPVTSDLSAGCHEWIRNRAATLVTGAQDVVDAAGQLGLDAAPLVTGDARPLDPHLPDVRDVYERMPAFESISVPVLADESGYAAAFIESALRQLAVAGLVSETLDGWARVPSAVSLPARGHP